MAVTQTGDTQFGDGTSVVTKPSGASAGNLIVVAQGMSSLTIDLSTITQTAPSGFTQLDRRNQAAVDRDQACTIWYKIADGGEGSTLTFTNSNGNYGSSTTNIYQPLFALCFTGVDITTPIASGEHTINSGEDTGGTSVGCTGFTAGRDGSLLVFVAHGHNDMGSTPPSGMSLISTFDSDFIAKKAINAGVTGNQQFSLPGADQWVAALFAVEPAVAATIPKRRLLLGVGA